MSYITIEAHRDAYSPKEALSTLTVGDLKYILEDFDDDTKVIISNDNGYTYGRISECDIEEFEESDN